MTADGRYLLAVDAGSSQISVLRIAPDGSLSPVPGGVVSSGGGLPVSIAIHGDLVYVGNASPTDSNFTGFRLGHGGQLTPIPGSTVSLPAGSQPGDVLFNGTGRKLVGTLIGSSQIASFTVGSNGLLTAAPGSPFTAQGLGPFGSEFRPGTPAQLFSHDGQYLFAVNTGSGSISSYSIGSDGSLSLIGSTPVSATGGVGAVDARLSPDGRFLYVNESKIGSVGIFAFNGGALLEVSGSPITLPSGATPAGMVVS